MTQPTLFAVEGGAAPAPAVPPLSAADKALVAVLTQAMFVRMRDPAALRLALLDARDLLPRTTPLHPALARLPEAATALVELGELDDAALNSGAFWRAIYQIEDSLVVIWARRAAKAVEAAAGEPGPRGRA